jgi:hypothetical protein
MINGDSLVLLDDRVKDLALTLREIGTLLAFINHYLKQEVCLLHTLYIFLLSPILIYSMKLFILLGDESSRLIISHNIPEYALIDLPLDHKSKLLPDLAHL